MMFPPDRPLSSPPFSQETCFHVPRWFPDFSRMHKTVPGTDPSFSVLLLQPQSPMASPAVSYLLFFFYVSRFRLLVTTRFVNVLSQRRYPVSFWPHIAVDSRLSVSSVSGGSRLVATATIASMGSENMPARAHFPLFSCVCVFEIFFIRFAQEIYGSSLSSFLVQVLPLSMPTSRCTSDLSTFLTISQSLRKIKSTLYDLGFVEGRPTLIMTLGTFYFFFFGPTSPQKVSSTNP